MFEATQITCTAGHNCGLNWFVAQPHELQSKPGICRKTGDELIDLIRCCLELDGVVGMLFEFDIRMRGFGHEWTGMCLGFDCSGVNKN